MFSSLLTYTPGGALVDSLLLPSRLDFHSINCFGSILILWSSNFVSGWSSSTWMVWYLCISCPACAAGSVTVSLCPNHAVITGYLLVLLGQFVFIRMDLTVQPNSTKKMVSKRTTYLCGMKLPHSLFCGPLHCLCSAWS